MKSCPTCQRQYEDETLKFCLEDGSALADHLNPTRAASAADATLHLPGSFAQPTPPLRSTEPGAAPRSTMTSIGSPGVPVMSGTTYSEEHRRSGALLWVIGALIIGVAAVAVAFIVTRNRAQDINAANQTATASPAPPTSEPTVGSGPSTATTTKGIGTDTAAQPQNRVTTPSPASAKEISPKEQEPVRKEVTTKQAETAPATNAESGPPAPSRERSVPSTVSGGVLNGKATYLAKPSYPAAARAVKASGAVTVQVTLDEQGNVISASALSGHPLLRASAVSAARASKPQPYKVERAASQSHRSNHLQFRS